MSYTTFADILIVWLGEQLGDPTHPCPEPSGSVPSLTSPSFPLRKESAVQRGAKRIVIGRKGIGYEPLHECRVFKSSVDGWKPGYKKKKYRRTKEKNTPEPGLERRIHGRTVRALAGYATRAVWVRIYLEGDRCLIKSLRQM